MSPEQIQLANGSTAAFLAAAIDMLDRAATIAAKVEATKLCYEIKLARNAIEAMNPLLDLAPFSQKK